MVSNLKLLQDTTSKTVYVTLHRDMVSSLMNLKNTRPYIYIYFCEHPESIYQASQIGSFGLRKTCDEVP
jgi:hypothetical protein